MSHSVRLGDCTAGRETAQIKQITDAVINYAKDTHGMRLRHVDRDQNYVNFVQEDTFVINEGVSLGLLRRFPGILQQGKTWKVPIDRSQGTSSRARSESPSRLTFSQSRYHIKMIILYTLIIGVMFGLKIA